jgi:ssDNA-binding Zn-finger/Zn-ribbon topoisomerase 1
MTPPGLQPTRAQGNSGSLADVVDTILDKGLVINADITVSVAGVELLGIKIRADLASFATAARYGLEFPSGTNVETSAWQQAQVVREACPQCGKRVPADELLEEQCPWCGWQSVRAKAHCATAGPMAVPVPVRPLKSRTPGSRLSP